jgi:GT2 family glycosyltransferase
MSERVGIVVIGRNEGERLVRCIRSLGAGGLLVYVDSGSTDDSPGRARALGADVVQLDTSIPFTAARARNAGFRRLLALDPGVEFVQFVDGDCTLDPGWLKAGAAVLRTREEVAIVCGRLREHDPDQSVYNKLADMEWNTPAGDVQSCGGLFLVRADRFAAVGGFLDDIVAGEEPDLCSRLIERGWKVTRLPAEMARHDIAMTRFSQWWRRQVRSGYGGLYAYGRARGRSFRPFEHQIRSARTWAVGWPLAIAIAVPAGAAIHGALGAAVMVSVVAAALPVQIARIALRRLRRPEPPADAFAYACFVMLAKFPQVIGQLRLAVERRRGVRPTIIEHK